MEKIICAVVDGLGEGYQHEILALDNQTAAAKWITGAHVRCLSFMRPPGRMKFFHALYRQLVDRKPALLMTYNWGATDAIWLGRLAGIRAIAHSEHGFNADEARSTNRKRNIIRAVVYRLASRIIVVSHSLRSWMKTQFGLMEPRVVMIPNGIDTARFTPDPSQGMAIRRTLGWQDADFVIGYAGRLDAVKDFPLMLEAFAAFLKLKARARLLIVGDGPERGMIDAICRAKGLTSMVCLVGEQSDIVPYLRSMDVFLNTSVREQMPISLLEAMAVGLPVVAAAVGDIPTMVEHGAEGYVVNRNGGPAAFSQALLLLVDQSQREKTGLAARRKALQYSDREMVSRYRALTRSLLDARPGIVEGPSEIR
jgi:glycosyltransferase involved in cell wall biosynthesis